MPDDRQVTSARDLGDSGARLIHEFPEYDFYWHISSIRFGKRVIHNYNKLIDHYPGADGMKTGFICASGYNLIASATPQRPQTDRRSCSARRRRAAARRKRRSCWIAGFQQHAVVADAVARHRR